MKGDRVAIRITGNEEAAEGTVGMRAEDRAAPFNDRRLIVRSPHPEQGRATMTELTKTGQKTVTKGAKAADVVERQMLSLLSAEEARLLRELLKRCAAALDDEPPNS